MRLLGRFQTQVNCLLSVALLSAVAIDRAGSAPVTPQTTKDFPAFCEQDIANCADVIGKADLWYVFHLSGKAPEICVVNAERTKDRSRISDASARKIEAWVKSHPEVAGKPLQEGLEAAMKATWPPPCKAG